MGLLSRFKSFVTGKPKFQLESNHVIKEAFIIGGVQYYCFDDIFTKPYFRALKAITYYEEFRMRCTREYLQAHVEATRKVLNEPKKNMIMLTDLHKMNEQLGDRLNWVVETDLLYKLASVVFFDGQESPYDYDMKYNLDKIAFWKKKVEMKAFFSQQAIRRLMPFLEGLDFDIQSYSEVVKKLTRQHLETLLPYQLNDEKRKDLLKSFGFVEEMPADSTAFAEGVLSNISPSSKQN